MGKKRTKAEVEAARLKKAGLKVVSFHLRPDLWKRFKVKLARDRLTIRTVVTAMVELYAQGGFCVEEENDQVDKK